MLTPEDKRSGLLVAVITGGRPQLKQRPTAKFLADLKRAGFTNICWVVAERDADGYERDEHELVVYPDKWAEGYAASHWMDTTPYVPGTFYGAFVGREYACLEAERRGCWGVLQLDDNIDDVSVGRRSAASWEVMRRHGELAETADLLAAVALSTNGRMVGAQLTAVPGSQITVSRPGFPYSCFIERVGEGREHWYGPFEDDITHAFQYGTRAEPGTALVVPTMLYHKEVKSKTGMRSQYNHERSVNLHRVFPQSVKVVAKSKHANGQGGETNARVFHHMGAGAIRNPQVVTDREMYRKVGERLKGLLAELAEEQALSNRRKVHKRVR